MNPMQWGLATAVVMACQIVLVAILAKGMMVLVRGDATPVIDPAPPRQISKQNKRLTDFELYRLNDDQCPDCNWSPTLETEFADQATSKVTVICQHCEARFSTIWSMSKSCYTGGTRASPYRGF